MFLTASDAVFRVGSQLVTYSDATPTVLEEIAKVFSQAPTPADCSEVKRINGDLRDVDSAMLALSECLLADYQGNLWIEAAVLVAPTQLNTGIAGFQPAKSVLICGGSESGKSTLTAALCERGWKMISEDIAFILPDRTIPQIIRPISLRPGTVERIQQAIGRVVRLFDDRWYFNPDALPAPDFKLPLPVSAVIMIQGVNPASPEPLAVHQTSAEQLVRMLLPYSNALRMDGGIEFLLQSLKDSIYASIEGGSIAQRIAAIEKLVDVQGRRMAPPG